VFDEDGKDRTPKSMLGQPALQAAHGALPKLGESFQAGGVLPGRAGDTAWHDSAAAADHAGAGAPARTALNPTKTCANQLLREATACHPNLSAALLHCVAAQLLLSLCQR